MGGAAAAIQGDSSITGGNLQPLPLLLELVLSASTPNTAGFDKQEAATVSEFAKRTEALINLIKAETTRKDDFIHLAEVHAFILIPMVKS